MNRYQIEAEAEKRFLKLSSPHKKLHSICNGSLDTVAAKSACSRIHAQAFGDYLV